MKSGSLNLLEHSGPHRACYGTALALPFTLRVIKSSPMRKTGHVARDVKGNLAQIYVKYVERKKA
jgi:hypothetical protein